MRSATAKCTSREWDTCKKWKFRAPSANAKPIRPNYLWLRGSALHERKKCEKTLLWVVSAWFVIYSFLTKIYVLIDIISRLLNPAKYVKTKALRSSTFYVNLFVCVGFFPAVNNTEKRVDDNSSFCRSVRPANFHSMQQNEYKSVRNRSGDVRNSSGQIWNPKSLSFNGFGEHIVLVLILIRERKWLLSGIRLLRAIFPPFHGTAPSANVCGRNQWEISNSAHFYWFIGFN